MSIDLVLSNGRIVSVDGIVEGAIAVDGGRIAAIGDTHALPAARRVIDLEGRLVLPGAIDGHTHLCEDLGVLAEPYETGGAAAAAGGITTVLLMPWDTPTLDSREVLEYRKRYATGRLRVDYGFHGTVTADTADRIEEHVPALWAGGVTALKLLMVTDDPAFPHLDDGQLVAVLRLVAKLGAVVTVHAENAAILKHNRERLLAENRRDPLAHEEYRSTLSENEAVRRLAYFAGQTGARVVVAHMSTADGVTTVRRAREAGVAIESEVCPRNLCLTTEDLAMRGPWVKTGPPVRSPAEVAALWPMLSDGSVSIVSSDHAAWTEANKVGGTDDIWAADGGIPQLQELLPLLLDAVAGGRLTFPDVVRLTSANPSRIFGLRPRKGAILPGYDADLVVVDPDRRVTIEPSMLRTAVGYSAYDGRTLTGWPVMTFVRGELVMEDGEMVGEPRGQFIPRVTSAH